MDQKALMGWTDDTIFFEAGILYVEWNDLSTSGVLSFNFF